MISVGDSVSEKIHVTKRMIQKYAELSGDKNPIHISEEYAAKTIFKKPIAHGMLIGGFISNVIGNVLPGYGTIYLKQDMNFLAPVYFEDWVEVIIKVIEKKDNKPIYKLSTVCMVENKTVVDGYAIVKFE